MYASISAQSFGTRCSDAHAFVAKAVFLSVFWSFFFFFFFFFEDVLFSMIYDVCSLFFCCGFIWDQA